MCIKIVPGEYNTCEITLALEPISAEVDLCLKLIAHDLIITVDVVYIQIRASDIDFWKTNFDTMKLKHEKRIYPPRVKMTIMLKDSESRKLLVRFVGSSNDNQLNTEVPLPLGMSGVIVT